MNSLPTELIDAISAFLRPAELAVLARVNSRCCSVSQRLLYRFISISPAFHNLQVVVTLSRKPDLARHVRSFVLSIPTDTVLFKPYYKSLFHALSFMTELETLDLTLDARLSWVLGIARASSLKHFACTFPFDSHVAAFLHDSNALLGLQVGSDKHIPSEFYPPIASTSFPSLSQFVGSSDTAQAIVPGRPVQAIQIISGDATDILVDSLAQSTCDVQVLSVSTSSLPVPLLHHIATRLSDLRFLQVSTSYISAAPGVEFYEQVSDALTGLHKLQGFELSGMHWASHQKTNDERVWQSKPLEVVEVEEEGDIYSDMFYVY